MAKTKNPFFANSKVKYYCDDTEPKLYPHAFTEFVPREDNFSVDEVREAVTQALREAPQGVEAEVFTALVSKNLFHMRPPYG